MLKTAFSFAFGCGMSIMLPCWAQTEGRLFLAYPPDQHQTQASQIFFIGSAPPNAEVTINGQRIDRSPAGYFAPSFPLQLGENRFLLRYQGQEIRRTITRRSDQPLLTPGSIFIPASLTPAQDMARLPGEAICFSVLAVPQAKVTVKLGQQLIPLSSQGPAVQLPTNAALLNGDNQPQVNSLDKYQGCTTFLQSGSLGQPQFQVQALGRTQAGSAVGRITLLDQGPSALSHTEVMAVTSEAGVTRTGPGSDYSRLTPLPKGTQASVTGAEGDWLRLDYGAWIHRSETRSLGNKVLPRSVIRSVAYRRLADATELRFPLEVPVPITLELGLDQLQLTLHNTTAQTDTIRLDAEDPVLKLLTWQQVNPQQITYTLKFKSQQQWGYDLRYEGTTLVLSLRHPPVLSPTQGNLRGIKILLDPGHGGSELGSVGPNGYPEKAINLLISQNLAKTLRQRGATVYLTRENDQAVSLAERVRQINTLKPNIALSIHYNALPDGGDALNTQGISAFWYQPQAQPLAAFLQQELVKRLNRSSYGLYWNNLALTRPYSTPSVLLELGFMINPQEFEWITDPQAQGQLVQALADSLSAWFFQQAASQRPLETR
ncbi:N-acetylmuramoyl-L-alanine amidase [Synechocystis sp. LKSZ1]|uniref:N-acetylmuramoyl-L-alanine amidase n=1 Tax=Synechocystis sp. LKSZ1 TaxID=3144951 RepID=UPI00336C2BE3